MIFEIYLTIAVISAILMFGWYVTYEPFRRPSGIEAALFAVVSGFLWPAILIGLLYDYMRGES